MSANPLDNLYIVVDLPTSLLFCKFVYHTIIDGTCTDLRETCFRMNDNIVLAYAINVVIFKTARENAGTVGALWLHLIGRYVLESRVCCRRDTSTSAFVFNLDFFTWH